MDRFLEVVESNKKYFGYPTFLHKLLIDSETPIFYLEDLKKLKLINIRGEDSYEQTEKLDYSAINNYTYLETLIITENQNIETLDISNLQNLHTLILFGNTNLHTLKGLENLKNLKTIVIVGNRIKELPSLPTILENTKRAKIFKIDINMYHYLDKNAIINSGNNVLRFAEKISVGEIYNLTLKMMDEQYMLALDILNKILSDREAIYSKIKKTYQYIVKTMTYDNANLKKRNNYILKGNSIEIYKNYYKHINSSYVALKKHHAVCEGYANAFKFLLNIEGFESETIVCFFKEADKPFEYYDHTAIRVKINGEWLYCDPEKEDDSANLKYFLLTREEFEETHKLQPQKIKRIGDKK